MKLFMIKKQQKNKEDSFLLDTSFPSDGCLGGYIVDDVGWSYLPLGTPDQRNVIVFNQESKEILESFIQRENTIRELNQVDASVERLNSKIADEYFTIGSIKLKTFYDCLNNIDWTWVEFNI